MCSDVRNIYRIERGARGPSQARQLVNQDLAGRLSTTTLDEIKLMVSEMVTVALARQSWADQRPITLELKLDRVVRCELLDHSRSPSLEHALDGDLALKLIDQLASGWGIARSDEGMRLWFEAPSS